MRLLELLIELAPPLRAPPCALHVAGFDGRLASAVTPLRLGPPSFGPAAIRKGTASHNFIGRITIGMFRRFSRRSMVNAASLCS